MTCPQNQGSVRVTPVKSSEGRQYVFRKSVCDSCPLREACTTSKTTGRTVFVSDYEELYKEATTYNETEAGKALLKKRYRVEPANNKLKNHCGLKRHKSRGQATLDIRSYLAAMVTNCKLTIKHLSPRFPGFLRYPRKTGASTSLAEV